MMAAAIILTDRDLVKIDIEERQIEIDDME